VEYSIRVCSEITKYVEDISIYDDSELSKLFNTLLPLLNLNDRFQLLRLEFLIGFPTISIEEPSNKYPFPFFGFHKMSDDSSKVYQYRSLINNRRSSCILRKLLSIKIRERTPCEFYISLLEASLNNPSLFKYVACLLSEEPFNYNLMNWGNNIIAKYQVKYENLSNFSEKLSKLNQMINEKLESILSDNEPSLIPNFSGFGKRNYLHKDIQMEIVSLVTTNDNLYLYKFEYFTSIIDFSKDLNYTTSKSFVPGMSLFEDEEKKEVI
jgi:hypothetical protein